MTALVFPAIILFAARTWRWLEGWLFGLWFDAMALSSMIYMYRHDPALLAERAKAPGAENQKTWDKYLIVVIYFIAVVWLIVMPLDAKRFGLSPFYPAKLSPSAEFRLLRITQHGCIIDNDERDPIPGARVENSGYPESGREWHQ